MASPSCTSQASTHVAIAFALVCGALWPTLCAAALAPRRHPVLAAHESAAQVWDARAVRAVDDVAPALRNATEDAVLRAHEAMERYSDVLFAVAIPVGAASAFFGYYVLGPVLFSAGFATGGCVCWIAIRAALENPQAAAWASIVAVVLGGGLCGFIAVKMLAVGMFAVGAALGVAASAALKVVLWARIFPAAPEAGFAFGAVVLGVVCGLLTLAMRKEMYILSTSYAGAFAIFYGIGHFAGHFPTLTDLDSVERGELDMWSLVYIVLTGLVGTVGMFVQLCLTREKMEPMQAAFSNMGHGGSGRRNRGSSAGIGDGSEWSEGEVELERELLAAQRSFSRVPSVGSGNEFEVRRTSSDLATSERGSSRRGVLMSAPYLADDGGAALRANCESQLSSGMVGDWSSTSLPAHRQHGRIEPSLAWMTRRWSQGSCASNNRANDERDAVGVEDASAGKSASDIEYERELQASQRRLEEMASASGLGANELIVVPDVKGGPYLDAHPLPDSTSTAAQPNARTNFSPMLGYSAGGGGRTGEGEHGIAAEVVQRATPARPRKTKSMVDIRQQGFCEFTEAVPGQELQLQGK